jgi:hypothetical protein
MRQSGFNGRLSGYGVHLELPLYRLLQFAKLNQPGLPATSDGYCGFGADIQFTMTVNDWGTLDWSAIGIKNRF